MTTKADRKRPLLVLESISKAYPGVVALSNVSMSVMAGEVLALIGENGAGKSTLMKILGGVVQPSSGHIIVDDVRCDRFLVTESQSAGIAFVHQELNVFDNLDVAANMFLGREIRSGFLGLLDEKAMRAAAEPLLRRVGAMFKPDTPVADLSLAERQLLEIAKALSIKARVIIMDEPTSSLTLSETKTLMNVIADLKAEGIAVIYISHRLSEIEECADRVFALRDGKAAGELGKFEINHDAMIRMMIGRDLNSLYAPPASPCRRGHLVSEGCPNRRKTMGFGRFRYPLRGNSGGGRTGRRGTNGTGRGHFRYRHHSRGRDHARGQAVQRGFAA
ncbi:ATP-binding cassette domain-containing protein [Phyllobacterium sp. A18/5-2]|uniref:ATP-binding cassette domain-containing protein n=1 Tax=Phyllobacterium sp. A18/5-2 TaxID=2978392 RepID=UPI003965CEA6